MDLLTGLERDYQRLAQVAEGSLHERVPTCPDWTVDDLVRHVAVVYLHKVECMRLKASPDPWPPDLSAEPTLPLLHRSYAELRAEFDSRSPESESHTWFEPDQSVGFWVRRMAHETVIHRIDGELGAGADSQPVDESIALDGIDEVLLTFLSWASQTWPEEFEDALSKGDGAVAINAGSARWLVHWDETGVSADPAGHGGVDADINGSPEAILRWLWRRAPDSAVQITGDSAKVTQLRELMEVATQ